MEVGGIVSQARAAATGAQATDSGRSDPLELGRESFMRLLLTQLRYQDPLQPMEDQDFIAQLAQLNTLEQLQVLNRSFEAFMQQQNLMRGTELLGRTIEGTGRDGAYVRGTVDSVSVRGGVVSLMVGGREVFLGDVTEVTE